MEKRINVTIESYFTTFKDDIKNKLLSSNLIDCEVYNENQEDNIIELLKSSNNKRKEKINELLEYIYEYERLAFQKEDLLKRKRIKNTIPTSNRCNAKRASGEQCTRRRKKDCNFCGTHSKGTPHGLVSEESLKSGEYGSGKNESKNEKVSVFTQEIRGIIYYIDTKFNIYKTEDILLGKRNPRIIAKWIKKQNNYCIEEFYEL